MLAAIVQTVVESDDSNGDNVLESKELKPFVGRFRKRGA